MTQSALDFSSPLARRLDPDTSHAAAARAREFVASHEGLIYGALLEAGERGATCKEIAKHCRLDSVQVARRMKGMEARRLIYRKFWSSPTTVDRHGHYEQTVGFESRDGCLIWWAA